MIIIIKHIIRVQCIVYSFFCVLGCSHSYDRFNKDIKIITKPNWINKDYNISKNSFSAVSKINQTGNIKDRIELAEDTAISKLKIIIKTNLVSLTQQMLSSISIEKEENIQSYTKIVRNIINNTTINNSILNDYIIREETFVEPKTNDLYIMMSITKNIIKKEFKKQTEIALKKNKNNIPLHNFLTKLITNINNKF